jgi:hypothetical protein
VTPDFTGSTVRFELRPRGETTLLSVTHNGPPEAMRGGIGSA